MLNPTKINPFLCRLLHSEWACQNRWSIYGLRHTTARSSELQSQSHHHLSPWSSAMHNSSPCCSFLQQPLKEASAVHTDRTREATAKSTLRTDPPRSANWDQHYKAAQYRSLLALSIFDWRRRSCFRFNTTILTCFYSRSTPYPSNYTAHGLFFVYHTSVHVALYLFSAEEGRTRF
jgi:hypothetical protein